MRSLKNSIVKVACLILIAMIIAALFAPWLFPDYAERIQEWVIGIILLGAVINTMYFMVIGSHKPDTDSAEARILAKIYEFPVVRMEPVWVKKLIESLKDKFSEKEIREAESRLYGSEIISYCKVDGSDSEYCYLIEDKRVMYLAEMIYDRINKKHKKALKYIKDLGYPLAYSGEKTAEICNREDHFLEVVDPYRKTLLSVPSSDLRKIRAVFEKCKKKSYFTSNSAKGIVGLAIDNIKREEDIRRLEKPYRD
ncbi:MAG: hypothetical protein NTU58_02435 [Candidatus Nealsonbacteria bacterium]|nr:hypothetical protein [Candidatus Nealsonbacteria bacterium]